MASTPSPPPTHNLRLALLTWNVGGAQAGIAPGTTTLLRCAANADVIIVGLQEVSVGRRGWKTHLAKALGPNWRYIGGESLAGLRLKAFARLRSNGRPKAHVAGAGMKVGAGFAARWPNKGAVAVEMRFSSSCRVLFVVAHLAANEHHVADRADDWRAILRRLDRDSSHIAGISEPVIPLFHRYEHVFVLGDLNYRIEAPGEDHAVRVDWVQQRVDARDWPALLAVDQLTRERDAGRVFANFQEAPVNFPPTFKIDPRTGRYSAARVPSYCDRILWHSLPARVGLVTNRRYEPLSEFRQSDHVPVVAEFDLSVPVIRRPQRTLSLPRGLRPVLEFMLVRFIKGKPPAHLLERHLPGGQASLRRLSSAAPQTPTPSSSTHLQRKATPRSFTLPNPSSLRQYAATRLKPDRGDDDEGDELDDDDDTDDEDDDDHDCSLTHIRDEFDDDEVDDDTSSISTDSNNFDDHDTHYSHHFDDVSDLYSPYEGAEAVPIEPHRASTAAAAANSSSIAKVTAAEKRTKEVAPRSTAETTNESNRRRNVQTGTTRNGEGGGSQRSIRKLMQKSSGDISSAFDEELLADMLTRVSASASSSTDTSTPVSTPRSGRGRTLTTRGTDSSRTGSSRSPNSGASDRGGRDELCEQNEDRQERNKLKNNKQKNNVDNENNNDDDGSGNANSSGSSMTGAHANSIPLKRDSLSKQLVEASGQQRQKHSKKKRRSQFNGLHMEIHGHGLFLKRDRVYRVSIPKRRNGARERIGESLPAIPLAAVASLDELMYRHVVVVFARMKSKVGTSGALPLRELLQHQGEPYAFEMVVTKYGEPIGIVEACVQLTVQEAGCWVDARGKVVRNFDGGSNKEYRGSLQVRRRPRARSKPGPVR